MSDPNIPVPGVPQGAVPPPPPPPMAQPYAAPSAVTPGKTIGIVSIIFAFLAPLIGLILAIIGKVQAKRVGAKNTPATVGLVLSIIFLVVSLIVGIVMMVTFGSLFSQCAELGPGVHQVGAVTITCG